MTSQMRQIVGERGDLLFAQRIGDIRHRGLGSAGAGAGLVVVQRLHEVFLALAGDARYRPRRPAGHNKFRGTCTVASWFETRGVAALLTMRV